MKSKSEQVGLPPRPFLYTLDQISALVSIPQPALEKKFVWFDGRSIGRKTANFMVARNIAPEDQPPDWRVMDNELVRWMRRKGFRIYERNPWRD